MAEVAALLASEIGCYADTLPLTFAFPNPNARHRLMRHGSERFRAGFACKLTVFNKPLRKHCKKIAALQGKVYNLRS